MNSVIILLWVPSAPFTPRDPDDGDVVFGLSLARCPPLDRAMQGEKPNMWGFEKV